MNLVKWFRKNNKKVMAVVVILLMIAFIMPASFRQLAQRGRGARRAVAYFGDGRKITAYDRLLAAQELELLRMVGANILLSGAQDLRAVLLGELLFSETRTSPALIRRIRQMIGANNYRISHKQLNDIYRRSVNNDIYWLLLKKEAELAGVGVSIEEAGRLLAAVAPRLFDGATYSQLIRPIVSQRGIPEKQILATLSDLLAVLEYARMVCSTQGVTASQIMHSVSREQEKIDVEFVRFDSSVFADSQDEPNERKIGEHFDKYKKFFAGAVGEENPYGLGCKLPDRVRIEYIALKLDDVSRIVQPPTQEEAEEYYQKYRDRFTEQVLSDPNDPNSAPMEKTRSYAQMANIILNQLLQERKDLKAETILQEAKSLTQARFGDADVEATTLSAEQYRQTTGDYETAADQLSKKYNIELYAGQTGMLSAADIQADRYLGSLYLKGYGYNVVGLPRIVFAVDELQASELGPLDAPKPRMYENIGPFRDMLGRIMVLVRLTEAQKASEPESIDQTFSKSTLELEQAEHQASEGDPNRSNEQLQAEDIYSVKQKVVEDLKKVAAMDTAKRKAEEFVQLVAEQGWQGAIDKFNQLYGRTNSQEVGSSDVFRLQNLTGLPRISMADLATVAARSAGSPVAERSLDAAEKERQFRVLLYSLVPQDANSLDTVPKIIEFKPDLSYYCLKNISVKRLTQDEYEKLKVVSFYKEEVIQSQSLAVVHFKPENILKRIRFRWIKELEEPAEANTPASADDTGEEAS